MKKTLGLVHWVKNNWVISGITIFFLLFFLLALPFQASKIGDLVAAATSSLTLTPVTLYLTPYESGTLAPGDVTYIDINLNARVPINALGITLSFSKDTLEVLGITKEKSFLDLWTEETSIDEQAGEIHFSGGTTKEGGMSGVGTMLTITIRSKKSGHALIDFKNAQVYASDGSATLERIDTEPLAIKISEPLKLTPVTASGPSFTVRSPLTNPDLNDDGRITLVDVSILTMHMWTKYDPRYDLDQDGTIGLGDLSILFSKF